MGKFSMEDDGRLERLGYAIQRQKQTWESMYGSRASTQETSNTSDEHVAREQAAINDALHNVLGNKSTQSVA